jgi:membrane protein YqaA with SNARE-associated domain
MSAFLLRHARLVSILIFIGSLALTVGVLFIPVDSQQLAAYGYGGIFVITFLGALSLFIPGPTMVAAYIIGSVLNPFWVALAAGLGSALGETSGYLAGYGSRAILTPRERGDAWYWRISAWVQARPFLAVFLLSAIPNPLTDVAGLVAGRIKFAYSKFLMATFLGKCIRFGLSAYLGARFGLSILQG